MSIRVVKDDTRPGFVIGLDEVLYAGRGSQGRSRAVPYIKCKWFWRNTEWVGQMGIATSFATPDGGEQYLNANRHLVESTPPPS